MAIKVGESGNMVVTGEHIKMYMMLTLEKRLKLEVMGLRFNTPTAPIVRQELGLKERNKKKLLECLQEYNARMLLNNSAMKEE